ncbi:MAG: 30S ribosomal protein S16 [Candidatus Yanofskybacteria bacterium]|nr:30S ribosomal protein S16 [Candidatus Yanofskybacteria bacterium]
MLKIRLQRIGKRGQAYFKVVVTEHTKKPKGKYLELLGSYDPHKNKMNVDAEKVKHWLSQGAKMSETVNNLLVGRGVVEGDKVKVWKPKNRRSAERPTADAEIKKNQETQKQEKPQIPAAEIDKKEIKTDEPEVETPKEEVKEEKKEEVVPAVAETQVAI